MKLSFKVSGVPRRATIGRCICDARFPSVIKALPVFLICILLPLWLDSCKAVPPGADAGAPVSELEAGPRADVTPQAPDGDKDYMEARPRSQIKDELTVAFSRGEIELDFRKSFLASEAQLFTAIYEGLFSYHPLTMAPIPAAASNWETSEDKKQWTFTIRESARFQNGDPLRAEDFRASWLSLLEPGQDAPYSSLFDIIEGARDYRLGRSAADHVGITAADEKTLVLRLNSPAAFLPSMLCHHSFSPIHPSMLKEEEWNKSHSNGPFYIKEIDEDHMLLEKNPFYWDARRVSLNKLTIKYPKDGDDAAALWNSGQARWIHGDINIDALTDRSGFEVNAMFATHYYFIRSARKPWDDHRLRRALSLVLPWDKLREGYALPAKTLVYPIPDYPKIEGLETIDSDEAKQLMAEAGYSAGAGLPELVIRITQSSDAKSTAALMAEAWYTTLGIPVRIETVAYQEYFQSLKRDDYDVGFTNWIGDFADPYTFLQMWCRDSNLNDARHNDDDYESLIEKSMTEEGTKRWETLAEAEKLLLSRGNVLPISHSPAFNIIDRAEIDGWYPNVLDIHPFKYLSIKVRRPLPSVVELPLPQPKS